jgi:hypothetical protein
LTEDKILTVINDDSNPSLPNHQICPSKERSDRRPLLLVQHPCHADRLMQHEGNFHARQALMLRCQAQLLQALSDARPVKHALSNF